MWARGASQPGGDCLLQGVSHGATLPTTVQDASRWPHATVSMWIHEKLTKLKIQSLGHTVHIASAQRPHWAGGWRPGQRRKRLFPLSQKILLDGAVGDR